MPKKKRVKPLIVGIVSERSGGKTTVKEYASRQPDIFVGRYSHILDDILDRLGIDSRSRPHQAVLAEALRHGFGAQVLSQALLMEGVKSGKQAIVLDGVRKKAELKFLRTIKNFRLLYITAPVEMRWERAFGRNHRHDDRVSLAEFKRIEKTLVTEKEIPALGRQADARIENTGTKQDLLKAVDAVLKKWGYGR